MLLIKTEHWSRVSAPDGKYKVIIDCPWCNRPLALPHSVSQDGVVRPSVVCTWEGCEFHLSVKLQDWRP